MKSELLYKYHFYDESFLMRYASEFCALSDHIVYSDKWPLHYTCSVVHLPQKSISLLAELVMLICNEELGQNFI